MKHLFLMGALAILGLAAAKGDCFAQAYPRNPYDYQPGNAGIMGIGPGGREAYHPDYYSSGGSNRSGGYGYGSYGYGPWNSQPNITGLPSQPMAAPDSPTREGYRSRYFTATASHPNAAAVDVKVPPRARLWFQGQQTQQQGSDRFFESPPLEPGKTYAYKVKAEWTNADGKKIERTQTVQVRAGSHVAVDLRKPPS